MFDKITNNIDELQDNIQSYVENTAEYYKLEFYKKSSKTAVSLVRGMLLGSILMLIVFFFSFAAAYLIGDQLGNLSHGFFIVAGFYFLVLVFAIIFSRKFIERIILRSTSKTFFND